MSTSGELLEYGYDYHSGNFNLVCQNISTSAVTVIYYPEVKYITLNDIEIEGSECDVEIKKYSRGSSGTVIIKPKNKTERLAICIKGTKKQL